MPEETARQILKHLKKQGVTARLGPNPRHVIFTTHKELPPLYAAANEIASKRGYIVEYGKTAGSHLFKIKTRKALLKQRLRGLE